MKKDKEGVWIISEKEAEVLNIGEKKNMKKEHILIERGGDSN